MRTIQFLGPEPSTNPETEVLAHLGRELARWGATEGGVTARHGTRSTTNAAGVPLSGLTPLDFVEVVDYDPRRDHLIVLGPKPPHSFAPLHALLLRAKAEIGGVLSLRVPPHHPSLPRLPQLPESKTPFEGALALLPHLREARALSVGGSILAVGETPRKAWEDLLKTSSR